MADIFISYKSERRPAARHLKKVLDCYFQTGAEECVWYDYGLVPGHEFEPRIMAEIAQAKVVLVLWCGMAVTSPWVAKEAAAAQKAGKFLPCRLESCALPADFDGADTINLIEWDASPNSSILYRLLDEVGRRIGREALSRVSRLRELEEDWRGFGAPPLAHFALGRPLIPEAVPAAPQPAAKPAPLLGDPPPGLSPNLALHWANAREGQSEALFQIGWHFLYGKGGLLQDDREAVRKFEMASAKGHSSALAELGFMYSRGRGGLPKDEREALRLFKLSAEQGDSFGQNNLGYQYLHGLCGAPTDEVEAARLFKLSADQGNMHAHNNLGTMFVAGKGGLPADPAQAVRHFQIAAEQGLPHAQNSLGTIYQWGLGVSRDLREAARFYRLAADQGYSPAQLALAVMYAEGHGVTKDEAEALRLYKLAARGGDTSAQATLKRRSETW